MAKWPHKDHSDSDLEYVVSNLTQVSPKVANHLVLFTCLCIFRAHRVSIPGVVLMSLHAQKSTPICT